VFEVCLDTVFRVYSVFVMCLLRYSRLMLKEIQARHRCIHKITDGYFMHSSTCQRDVPFETLMRFYEPEHRNS